MPYVSTDAMNVYLAEIAKIVAGSAHAVLVMDGAGWHGSAALRVPDITIVILPPDAPELNPVAIQPPRDKRLRQLRRHCPTLLRDLKFLRGRYKAHSNKRRPPIRTSGQ